MCHQSLRREMNADRAADRGRLTGPSSYGGDGPEGALLDSDRDCLRNRVDVVRHSHRRRMLDGLDPCPHGQKPPDAIHPGSLPSTSSQPLNRNTYEWMGPCARSHARSCQPSSIMNAAVHQSVRCHDPSPIASLGTSSRPSTAADEAQSGSVISARRSGPLIGPALHGSIGSSATRPERPGQYCPMIRAHVTGEHPCPAAGDRRHSCKVGAIPKLERQQTPELPGRETSVAQELFYCGLVDERPGGTRRPENRIMREIEHLTLLHPFHQRDRKPILSLRR